MGLSGIEIFKLTPKSNCKDCGLPTCMAFAMKVAQGAVPVEKCPHFSAEAMAKLSDATAPPMKTITVGSGETEHTLGGETVLYRHEKTFVSKTMYAVSVCVKNSDEEAAKILADLPKVDYVRIGERMYVEFVYVNFVAGSDKDRYVELVKKAAGLGRAVILGCSDVAVAKEALPFAGAKAILNGATAENYKEMNELAKEFEAVLGVRGGNLDEVYDTVVALEGLGNKNLIMDVTMPTIKDTFAAAVEVRRGALKGQDRSCGYPSLVVLTKPGFADDPVMQTALATLFTLKYGSIIVMSGMSYAQALPLYGLRQNVFTDPQKPMRVEPGIYKINGADENAICALTVDFALSYFVISGEMERSGVPINLVIPDAGGYSVLTSWAAGKLSASSIAKFFEEQDIAGKIKSRKLVIPGKVAVLKGELQDKLPGWEIIVGPNEAAQAVKFFRNL